MFPVLSPLAGGLGTIWSRTEVPGAVLGPRVGSMCWDLVDPGWGMWDKPGPPFWVGSRDAQTVSMLALPGMATELHLGEEEAWSDISRGQNG